MPAEALWQQLKLRLRSRDSEAAEARLWRHGALSVSYTDASGRPLFQQQPGDAPLWEQLTMTALFPKDADLGSLRGELQAAFPELAPVTGILEEQQWERAWMADFRPMQFGSKLWVCPTTQSPPDPDAVNIMLDPGLAFGAGNHPTTGMCLRRLGEARLEGLSVIDYGCGSGILAIAAALLGAWPVFAVDHDPQALTASRDNCRRNGLPESCVTVCSPEQLPALQADLLLANILAEPLLELRDHFCDLIKPGGTIILSGILDRQSEHLQRAYGANFHLAAPVVENEWVLLTGRRAA